METVTFIVTDAGRQAMINASRDGTQSIRLTEVAYGGGRYTPTPSMTSLLDEIKRVPARASAATGDGYISVNALDDSTDAYAVYEAGIYATVEATGAKVLFAIHSRPAGEDTGPLLEKTKVAQSNIDFDLFVGSESLAGTVVQFGDTNFLNPHATTQIEGVLALAMPEEIAVATNGTKAVTPAALLTAMQMGAEQGIPQNRLREGFKAVAREAALEAVEEASPAQIVYGETAPEASAMSAGLLYLYQTEGMVLPPSPGGGDSDVPVISESIPENLEDGQTVILPASDRLAL